MIPISLHSYLAHLYTTKYEIYLVSRPPRSPIPFGNIEPVQKAEQYTPISLVSHLLSRHIKVAAYNYNPILVLLHEPRCILVAPQPRLLINIFFVISRMQILGTDQNRYWRYSFISHYYRHIIHCPTSFMVPKILLHEYGTVNLPLYNHPWVTETTHISTQDYLIPWLDNNGTQGVISLTPLHLSHSVTRPPIHIPLQNVKLIFSTQLIAAILAQFIRAFSLKFSILPPNLWLTIFYSANPSLISSSFLAKTDFFP